MNTRSRGTSTLSKMTNASCSSNRPDSGWLKSSRGSETLSRQRNLSPGVAIGMLKVSACAPAAFGIGWLGYTAISSENGAKVASTRAPRTRMPCAVSSTLCSCVASRPVGVLPLPLSTVAWISVWVRLRSLRAMNFW